VSGRRVSLATGEHGFSLIETVVGLSILLVVAGGLLPLAVMTLKVSENEGHLSARATEYAQDKLEQLMALSFDDTISDTRVFPATDTGGSGLTPGGSSNAAAAVHLYVDYLDIDGALLASTAGSEPSAWYYKRVWQVEEVGAPDPVSCPTSISAQRKCLKRITVTATVRRSQGSYAVVPRATVTALKTYPF
jgi:prepilin-type N-terminal cleavage/methylation domain-containing protein